MRLLGQHLGCVIFRDDVLFKFNATVGSFLRAMQRLGLEPNGVASRVSPLLTESGCFELTPSEVLELLCPSLQEGDLKRFDRYFAEEQTGFVHGGFQIMRQLQDRGKAYHGLHASRKFCLGIHTTESGEVLRTRLKHLGISSVKNTPEFFIEASSRFVDPGVLRARLSEREQLLHETVFVGSAVTDYHSAKEAGVNFVGVVSSHDVRQAFVQEGLDIAHLFPSLLAVYHQIDKISD